MERVRPQPATAPEGRRMSIFTEVGLVDEDRIREERSPVLTHGDSLKLLRPAKLLRFRSRNSVLNEEKGTEDDDSDWESVYDEDDDATSSTSATVVQPQSNTAAKMYRLGLLSLMLALMLPILQLNPISRVGAWGGVIPTNSIQAGERSALVKREDSPTNVCTRWSGQSAVVNGTLYMYGFRTSTQAQQQSDTWSECHFKPYHFALYMLIVSSQ